MVELADNLVDDFDIVDLLGTLTERCVDVLDIAAAGIMLADSDEQLRPMISSDETVRITELYRIQAEEGPGQECFRTGACVVNQDLSDSHERWPLFAPVAMAAGFRSVDAIPLRLRGQVIGALNLFRDEMGALGPDDVARAQALADIATIAILQHRIVVEARSVNAQLSMALSRRTSIEQACGVIAERQHLSIDEAFDQLRRYARDNHLRVADLARATVLGDIDPTDISSTH